MRLDVVGVYRFNRQLHAKVFFAELGDLALEQLVRRRDEIGPAQPVHRLGLGVGRRAPTRQYAGQTASARGERTGRRKLQRPASTDSRHRLLLIVSRHSRGTSNTLDCDFGLGVEEMHAVRIDRQAHPFVDFGGDIWLN